uniref:Phosphoserine phosphatase n=1 Tax=Geobacillus sp. (strain Y4.1MC1) TaxID=581103 RepID=A0A7U3YD75_GEOS0
MKEYLILADVKAVVSMKVQANNQQEAEMIAQRQLNDLSVANVKLELQYLNNEIVKPNVEDFYIEVSSIEEGL